MSVKYKCHLCFFITSRKCNINYHFNRKKKCSRNPNCHYTPEEIEYLDKKQFEHNYKHLIKESKFEEEVIKEFNQKNLISTQNTINNITNNTNNTNNITNNTIININIKNDLIPFDREWDISSIDDKDKFYLMFSKYMYTKLLELILQKDINSNVVIDNNSNKGLAFYKINEENVYESIEIETLVSESMLKLHNQLIEMYKMVMNDLDEDIKRNMIKEPEFLKEFLRNVDKKYQDFQDKTTIKKKVKDLIIEIYKRNQKKALEIMKDNKSHGFNPIQEIQEYEIKEEIEDNPSDEEIDEDYFNDENKFMY